MPLFVRHRCTYLSKLVEILRQAFPVCLPSLSGVGLASERSAAKCRRPNEVSLVAGLCIIQTDRRAGGRARPAPVTTPRSTLTKRPLLVRNNDGVEAGRDPETITVREWLGTPHGKKNPYAVMREKCLDCCCGQVSEVRLCTAVDDCRPGRPGSAFAVRCMMGFWTRKKGELAEFRTTPLKPTGLAEEI